MGKNEREFNIEGRLSEEDDEVSEDSDGDSEDLDAKVEQVSNDWSLDKVEKVSKRLRLTSTVPSTNTSTPTTKALTTTPPQISSDQSQSSLSDFSSPLPGIETTPPRPKKGPAPKTSPKPVNRALFPHLVTDAPQMFPAVTTRAAVADWQLPPALQLNSLPSTPSRSSTDLSEVFPQGYSVVPLTRRQNKKNEKKEAKQKKRPVSSPNLPANKASRMDRLELQQANQNEILQNLANQIGSLVVNLANQQKK